jgi:hypothetical protein
MVPAQVHGDGPQPWPQIHGPDPIRVVPIERPIGPDESLLSEVFGFLMVSTDATQTPKELSAHRFDDGGECRVQIGGQGFRQIIHY